VLYQLVAITHPDFIYKKWHGFLAFEALNAVAALFNLYERFLPAISKTSLFFSVAVGVAFFITLFAAPSSKASAHQVFVDYYNVSGWSDGVAFFIGINVINWSFSCLDSATHLAEEIPNPRKNIPKALLVAVTISIFAGILTVLAIFFAAIDLPNEFSVFQILYDVYHENTACPVALGVFLLLSTWASVIGGHTWAARIAWAIGRDNGFPFSSRIGSLAPPPFKVPLWAHLWSVTWVAICGVLYLASTTVFFSFISGGLILQQLTYSAPIILLLLKGRSVFPHGPFWLPKLGLVANVVVVAWTMLTLVFYSFPYYLPVLADQMNYVSVVLVLVFMYAGLFWVFYARKNYVLVDLHVVPH
jgi:choline transport protein